MPDTGGHRRPWNWPSRPGRFLSTVQIGITLVGIFAGAFGGATLAEELAAVIAQVPALAPYSGALGESGLGIGWHFVHEN